MIRLITTLIITLFAFMTTVFAQEITGDWHGQLDIQGTKLRISFHISEKDKIHTSTMDSPDQGAFGIPTDKTIYLNDSLSISLKSIGVTYTGKLKADKIEGIFKQGGMSFPLVLSKKAIKEKKQKLRPQDPKEPYGYKSEEVFFTNSKANNIKLAGTLTLPKGIKNPPVAILISGSGPQNRNEEVKIFNHRPFLVVSDYLTKKGIAVLRYDDRGVAESEGTQKDATSADFATDVEAAYNYLLTRTDINIKKIGLIGHSEGGFIAPMVAAKNKNIAFIVLLAGTGADGGEVLRTQTKKAMEIAGLDKEHIAYNDKISAHIYNLIKTEKDTDLLKEKMDTYLTKIRKEAPKSIADALTDAGIKSQVNSVTSPWLSYFIKTDPDQFLSKTKCPVLAINGSKDFQVVPKLNLEGIEKSLRKAKNKDITIKELKDLNHLFQTCKTGASDEYAKIEETFAPKALQVIADWINKRF